MNTEQSYKITSGSVTMPELDSAKRTKFLQQLNALEEQGTMAAEHCHVLRVMLQSAGQTIGVHLLTSSDGEQESFITIPK